MGQYINPSNMAKEKFLDCYGRIVSASEAVITPDEFPVCLVDNGLFTAAGIAFDQGELDAFKHPDSRPKVWYMVPREHLHEFLPERLW